MSTPTKIERWILRKLGLVHGVKGKLEHPVVAEELLGQKPRKRRAFARGGSSALAPMSPKFKVRKRYIPIFFLALSLICFAHHLIAACRSTSRDCRRQKSKSWSQSKKWTERQRSSPLRLRTSPQRIIILRRMRLKTFLTLRAGTSALIDFGLNRRTQWRRQGVASQRETKHCIRWGFYKNAGSCSSMY